MTGASSGATHAPWGLADAQVRSPRRVGIADKAYGLLLWRRMAAPMRSIARLNTPIIGTWNI